MKAKAYAESDEGVSNTMSEDGERRGGKMRGRTLKTSTLRTPYK